MKTTTYRAVQVSKPGRMGVVERELMAPPPGKVRIRVEACGVCHSDSATVDGIFPGVTTRASPDTRPWAGSMRLATVFRAGRSVSAWVSGFSAALAATASSAAGDLVNCRNQEYTGIHHDGGYAEVMIAKASGLMSIPDDLPRSCGAALMRGTHDVQRPAERAGEGR